MYYFGIMNNIFVEAALEFLPKDVFEIIESKFAFTIMNSDACRVARQICKNNELIIFSHWIFPKNGFDANDRKCRYFIFCVLHEVAHAFLKHKSKLFDNLSDEDNLQQEHEADNYAQRWFNNYVSESKTINIQEITIREVEEQKEINQQRLDNL
jgi:hypothetical protein